MPRSTPVGGLAATRLAALLGDFRRDPAYQGLAEGLTVLIGDGRVPVGTRLPSERDLTAALDVSRTTVTRAYAALRETGWAEARHGSGTYARLPGDRLDRLDRALVPRTDPDRPDVDLGCAAPSAPPGVAEAYAAALADLPAHLGGHGYFPAGLPALQEAVAAGYAARGLPTDPGQVLVVPGALSGAAVVAHALVGRGDRVLVESPVYPNATDALAGRGARLLPVPVDPDGWDLDALGAATRRARARLAYLVPDFQNPTGHLMSDAERASYAGHLRAAGTRAVVDEAHQALLLDEDVAMPRPFAVHAPDAVSIGSLSKSHWGGLRVGWVRAPHDLVADLTAARVSLDLGVPVLEQLAAVHLLADAGCLQAQRARLREQREALLAALADRLPDWRVRRPAGGLVAWCELPEALAVPLTLEAERRGVVVTPGPVFAVGGGLGRFVRVPWTRPAAELEAAVAVLAAAWDAVRAGRAGSGAGPRVLIA